MLMCLIPSGDKFDHLIEVEFISFLHSKFTFFLPFVVHKYLVGRQFEIHRYPVFSYIFVH